MSTLPQLTPQDNENAYCDNHARQAQGEHEPERGKSFALIEANDGHREERDNERRDEKDRGREGEERVRSFCGLGIFLVRDGLDGLSGVREQARRPLEQPSVFFDHRLEFGDLARREALQGLVPGHEFVDLGTAFKVPGHEERRGHELREHADFSLCPPEALRCLLRIVTDHDLEGLVLPEFELNPPVLKVVLLVPDRDRERLNDVAHIRKFGEVPLPAVQPDAIVWPAKVVELVWRDRLIDRDGAVAHIEDPAPAMEGAKRLGGITGSGRQVLGQQIDVRDPRAVIDLQGHVRFVRRHPLDHLRHGSHQCVSDGRRHELVEERGDFAVVRTVERHLELVPVDVAPRVLAMGVRVDGAVPVVLTIVQRRQNDRILELHGPAVPSGQDDCLRPVCVLALQQEARVRVPELRIGRVRLAVGAHCPGTSIRSR